MTPDTTLRAATLADLDFVCRVVERSMRGYIEQTWGSFDAVAVRDNAEKMIATGTYAIIERGEEDIGVLHVERDPGDLWLASLFILPEHQGQGIGTRFLRELKAEAAKSRKPLRLRVLTANPAKRLYEREGFTIFTTTFGRTYMQWAPEDLAAPRYAGDCTPEVRTVLDACGITPDLVAERFLVFQPEARELDLVAREESGREHRLAPAAARAWREMQAAAAADGIALRIVSAFRSVERQVEIVRAKLERGQTVKEIVKASAPPGYSEHHTGLAVDIGTDGSPPLEQAFEETPAFEWLMAHGERFGFRLSYPRSNPYNYEYEPWHWCFGERKT
jgi:D-alanyl-D-alanine carboxypeptidase